MWKSESEANSGRLAAAASAVASTGALFAGASGIESTPVEVAESALEPVRTLER